MAFQISLMTMTSISSPLSPFNSTLAIGFLSPYIKTKSSPNHFFDEICTFILYKLLPHFISLTLFFLPLLGRYFPHCWSLELNSLFIHMTQKLIQTIKSIGESLISFLSFHLSQLPFLDSNGF
jgi:hypothetical protein